MDILIVLKKFRKNLERFEKVCKGMKAVNLKKIRTSLGLSQVDISRACGVSQARISQIESGIRPISERVLNAICNAFWFDRDEILGENYYKTLACELIDKLTDTQMNTVLDVMRNFSLLNKVRR